MTITIIPSLYYPGRFPAVERISTETAAPGSLVSKFCPGQAAIDVTREKNQAFWPVNSLALPFDNGVFVHDPLESAIYVLYNLTLSDKSQFVFE